MPTYQGHKNWNHWNVSLWISNEYDVYKRVQFLLSRKHISKNEIATVLLGELRNRWGDTTPDGAPLTYTGIRAHLTGVDRNDY
jgi:hypothetical protein